MNESDVRYGLEVIGDTIPGREGGRQASDGSRYSPLRDQIELIKVDEQYWGQWIAIADYGSGATAGGAMRDMKHYYGEEPEICGLTFTTHRYAVKGEDGEPKRTEDGKLVKRCKLLVRYDIGKIDPEARRKWERNKIMVVGREAARKLGIDVDAISPEETTPSRLT